MYTIEKGIEPPVKEKNKWIQLVKPMEVGDSIWLEKARQYSSEVNLIRNAGRLLGYRMISKTFNEPERDGVRIWRVEGVPIDTSGWNFKKKKETV